MITKTENAYNTISLSKHENEYLLKRICFLIKEEENEINLLEAELKRDDNEKWRLKNIKEVIISSNNHLGTLKNIKEKLEKSSN